MVRKQNYYGGLLITKSFNVQDVNRKFIIPLELTEGQNTMINKFYKLESLDRLSHSIAFIEKVEKTFQRIIKHQVKQGKRYFKRHPEKWVRLAKPVKIKDEEIQQNFMLTKLNGK